MEAILWPREQGRYSSQEFIDLWSQRQVEIVDAFGPWDVPEDITWAEDPFSSRVWSAYFQSMGWAYGAEAAFKAGEFNEFPSFIKDLILDFAQDNQDLDNPNHPLTFHDGANAFRVANISYWFENYLKPGNAYGVTFTEGEMVLLRSSLDIQLESLLIQLVDRADHWEANNHRFFHSMALSSYASIFGSVDPSSPLYEPNAETLLNQGLAVIDEILGDFIFISEGVTAEQSFTYHRLALGLVIEAIESVVDAGYGLSIDFDSLINKMYEFDLLTRRPAGDRYDLYFTEVGDSYFGGLSGSFYLNQLKGSDLITSPLALWIESEGLTGVRPSDVNVFDSAGYVVVRPEYKWEDPRDMRVFLDASPARHSHGHYDNSNVLLSLYGEKILIDSGGPFSYDNINPLGYDLAYNESLKEFYFVSSEAHNVVVVDGFSSDADTDINTIMDTDGYTFVNVSRPFAYVLDDLNVNRNGLSEEEYVANVRASYDPIELTRNLIVLKDSGLTIVLDEIENLGSDAHDYTLPWHFDPDALGLTASADVTFSINGVYGDAAFRSSHALEFNLFEGYYDDQRMQGWVTPDLYEIEPAPVVELGITDVQDNAWLLSAFGASLSESPSLLLDGRMNADSSFSIYAGYEGFFSLIDIDPEGLINVSSYRVQEAGAFGDIIMPGGSGGNLIGTDADDWIVGDAAANTIYGLDGSDLILGEEGDDRLIGGNGNNSLYGGPGADSIYALYGNNLADDGAGNDYVRFGDGDDTIWNGTGDDRVVMGGGTNRAYGNTGKDTYYGGGDFDLFIVEGSKSDFTISDRGAHVLVWDRNTADGDMGINYLFDFEQIDFAGSDDNVFIDRLNTNDTFRDGLGNDLYILGGGTDRIYAGAGFDEVLVMGSFADFVVEERDTHTLLWDRNSADGDLGRNYLYDVERIAFTDQVYDIMA